MRFRVTAMWGIAISSVLVGVIPATAQIEGTDLSGALNDRQAQSGFARAVEPRLAGASAAELIGENACTRAHGWSVGLSNQAVVRHVSAPAMEPRITSVPIALVVGGVLIATLGITQQVRRSRASRL